MFDFLGMGKIGTIAFMYIRFESKTMVYIMNFSKVLHELKNGAPGFCSLKHSVDWSV